MSDETVLIAGAGLAGARVAETLRALGRRGRIVLAGDEPHAPYERPALSKEFLAGERDDVSLRPPSFWQSHRIELRRGQRVERVDLRSRTALVGGELLHWDALVVATGARARTASRRGLAADAPRRADDRAPGARPRPGS